MTFLEYIPLAVRTESPKKHDGFNYRLVHAAMGVLTESIELEQHVNELNLREEIGDVCWYVAIALNNMGVSDADGLRELGLEEQVPSLRYSPESLRMTLIFTAADLVDMAKKHMFYNRIISYGDYIENLRVILERIRMLCHAHEIQFSDVLEANIRKLRTRYPEKFTDDHAVNRDLQAEQSALS